MQYAVELGNAAIRNISEQIAAIFTANSHAGALMADGGSLFNNTAVTTARADTPTCLPQPLARITPPGQLQPLQSGTSPYWSRMPRATMAQVRNLP